MKYDCLIVDDDEVLSESTHEYFNMFDVKTAWVNDQQSCLDFLALNIVGDDYIDEVTIFTMIIENPSYLKDYSLIDGRTPRHDNEIVLGVPALTATLRSKKAMRTSQESFTASEDLIN